MMGRIATPHASVMASIHFSLDAMYLYDKVLHYSCIAQSEMLVNIYEDTINMIWRIVPLSLCAKLRLPVTDGC